MSTTTTPAARGAHQVAAYLRRYLRTSGLEHLVGEVSVHQPTWYRDDTTTWAVTAELPWDWALAPEVWTEAERYGAWCEAHDGVTIIVGLD